MVLSSVADPYHFDADLDPDPVCHFDADPDPTLHFDVDPVPDHSFQKKALNLEKVLKYILDCHLQIDADPNWNPADHFGGNPDPA
jgi:hypothetical protein